MTPQQFTDAYLEPALRVNSALGLDPSVLLAQWADETSWGVNFGGSFNLAGIRCGPRGSLPYCNFVSLDDFADTVIATFRNGLYNNVLASAGSPALDQIAAIGASPWSADHYGSPPGHNLIAFWQELNLTIESDVATIRIRVDQIIQMQITGTDAAVNPSPFDSYEKKVLKPELDQILAKSGGSVDTAAILAAIADLKQHPTFDPNDAVILGIVQKIENALKSA